MTGKAEARRQAVIRRREAAGAPGGDPTAALLEAVAPFAGPVAGYLPIGAEIDPRPAMARLAEARAVAVPVVEGPDRPLRFRLWRPGAALAEGPFGTRHPADGDWIRPAVVIVPCLAFDRRGARLGYGGGFYDRTLAALRAGPAPAAAIGLAFAAQEVAAVPQEPTDQPLDLIVTEAGILRPGPADPRA